jgi:hypothetical protein
MRRLAHVQASWGGIVVCLHGVWVRCLANIQASLGGLMSWPARWPSATLSKHPGSLHTGVGTPDWSAHTKSGKLRQWCYMPVQSGLPDWSAHTHTGKLCARKWTHRVGLYIHSGFTACLSAIFAFPLIFLFYFWSSHRPAVDGPTSSIILGHSNTICFTASFQWMSSLGSQRSLFVCQFFRFFVLSTAGWATAARPEARQGSHC